MTSWPKLLVMLVIGAVIGGAAGFFYGARVGVYENDLLQSSVKAALLTGELRALRAGAAEKLIRSKELELDGEIEKYGRFLEEGHPWIFWPDSGNYEHDRYMKRVAQYRREYPAVAPTLKIEDDNPMRDDLRAYGKDVERRTRELLDKYGK